MTTTQLTIGEVTLEAISENAILLSWPEKICPQQHQHILQTEQQIKKQLSTYIVDTVVAYHSLIIYYHFEQLSIQQVFATISNCLSSANKHSTHAKTPSVVEIPVCYHPSLALDLDDICQQTRLTTEQVKSLHQQTYTAYALGFTPGFCYLATLDKKLRLPRRTTPRTNVPAGAVAIAEQQTAIYPTESPGGWHIIGQTPIELYRAKDESFLPKITVGDQVKFTEICLNQFNQYQQARN